MIYRKAKMSDVESIHRIIYNYADQRLMLARSRSSIYENLREYTVAEDDGQIAGVGGLHIMWHDLAEVRALAIEASHVRKGIGRQIIALLEQEARDLGLSKLCALTYQKDFFLKCGFEHVENASLPQKVWRECIDCPKFPDCDEQAMVKML